MQKACGQDGRFAYQTIIESGSRSPSYNIVRHAGAIYALTMLQRTEPDARIVETTLRAASFLKTYIGPGAGEGQLAVWSKPYPQHSVADLGATGLGLAALTAVEEDKPGSVPPQELQTLGRFLIFLQRPDGSFISKYRTDSGPDESFDSLYYPGEAALGLIDLYAFDHNKLWLKAVTKALLYLAKSRAALADVPPDHWALIATAALLKEHHESLTPEVRSALIDHAVQRFSRSLTKGPASPAFRLAS